MNLRGQVADGSPCSRLDCIAEPSSKADRAQDAEFVLLEPRIRIADRANDPGFDIRLTLNVINDMALDRIVEQPVYRKVPSLDILPGIGKHNTCRAPSIDIGLI